MLDIDRLTDELVVGTKAMVDRQLAGIRATLDEQIKANTALSEENRQLREQLEALTKRLDDLPTPEPGEPGAPGEKGEPGPSGVGVTDAVINRSGELVLTLTDGATKNVGVVVGCDGRDGDPGQDGADGREGVDGMDGKDADPEQIRAIVEEALPSLVDKAHGLVTDRLEQAIAEIPVPKDGRDGADGEKGEPGDHGADGRAGVDGKDGADGRDGIGIAETLINRSGELVLTLTDGATKNVGVVVGRDGVNGIDGQKGDPGLRGEPGEDGADGIDGEKGDPGEPGEKGDPGTDGKDADPEQIKALIADALPGLVDKARGELTRRLDQAIAAIPEPKDGRDGLGFDDLRLEYDGERTLSLVFERGEEVKEHAIKLSHPLDQGVWKPGTYEKGDGVTVGGSLWFAQRDTDKRPGHDNKDWRLAVKRGRDAKPAKPIREDEE